MPLSIDFYPRVILEDFYIQDKFYNISPVNSPTDLNQLRATRGSLEICESLHLHPRERFVIFRTTLDEMRHEMQTACGPIVEDNGYLTITTTYGGKNTYTFKILQHRFSHVCEVCGKTELLTPEEAFEQGWDYPPRMGTFGVLSPRTCGSCAMVDTLYWKLVTGELSTQNLDERQRETLLRIQGEPESLFS